jgi:hypothetical protein
MRDFFDRAGEHYGMERPVHYRGSEAQRLETLASLGVTTFTPHLYYPTIPCPNEEQLAAVRTCAEADDRLGEPFLPAVLHDTAPGLLGVA